MEEGVCPNCGSHDVTYGDSQLDGNSLGYNVECDQCHTRFTEWYDLVYSETIQY